MTTSRVLFHLAARGEITLPALLHEMADRDVVASLPAPGYTLKQSSSHDPRKTDPANAEGWHSNNDHDDAIRTEVNGGRNEWVIMEDKGPGAVVRYWTPLAEDRNNQIIRFYSYAWGMADFFSSPFISMPRRKIADHNNWLGYTTTSRVRPLDSIPFKSALKHEMEIWHWANCKVDYAVGTFWYARPGARHNRQPQPTEAAAAVRELPGVRKIAGAIECDVLTVSATSPRLQVGEQAGDKLAGGSWSGDKQVFVQSTKVGDFIEFAIPVADDKPHKLTLYATRSYGYGMLRFTVNGKPAGKEVDFHHPEAMLAEPVDLGTHQAKDGKLLLRAEVTGANAASSGPRFYCGFDCIALH